jgi:hypothetical protein
MFNLASFKINFTLTINMILIVFQICLLAPYFAKADQTFDTVSESKILQELDLLKKQPDYNKIMLTLRNKVRGLLQNLYRKSKADPNFRIGGFPLAEFFRRLDQFELLEGQLNIVIKADPDRDSDFYLLRKNIAFINNHVLGGSKKGLTALCIHVILGSMGFQDQDYQMTLSLILAELAYSSSNKSSPFRNIDFKNILPKKEEEYFSINPVKLDPRTNRGLYIVAGGGGATGIGGGGDLSSVEMKLKLLEYMIVRLNLFTPSSCGGKWNSESGFVKSILYAKLESSTEISDKPQYGEILDGKIKIIIPKSTKNQEVFTDQLVISTLAYLCKSEEAGL